MIWLVLAFLGVPLWLCAVGITVLVFRVRSLRHRGGNIPVRVLRPGHTRWTRGQGVWVANVFAWRGSPAAWTEDLVPVDAVEIREATAGERKPLHRLGPGPTVAVLTSTDGQTLTLAATRQHTDAVQGPFAVAHLP